MTGVIVYLLFFGSICAYVASKKNRNVIGYFFLGFVTGVIGLIALLFLPKRGVSPAAKCPFCRSALIPGTETCPECGHEVEP